MPPERQAIVDEINQIIQRLETVNDISPYYLGPLQRKLRDYVYQEHAEYERSMETLIINRYLKQQTYEDKLLLLEQISFDGKMKLVENDSPHFPLREAKKLNIIRNLFAHKNGRDIRNTYNTDEKLLKIYKFLDKVQTKLDDFWTPRSSDTED